MTMFSYVTRILVKKKSELLEEAKYAGNADYRAMLFREANEIDLALDLLLKPEDKI